MTQCQFCYNFINEVYPTQVDTRQKKAMFLARLADDQNLRTEFDEGLASFLAKLNERGFGRRKKDDEGRPSKKQALMAQEASSTEYRTRKGVFWPRSIYKGARYILRKTQETIVKESDFPKIVPKPSLLLHTKNAKIVPPQISSELSRTTPKSVCLGTLNFGVGRI